MNSLSNKKKLKKLDLDGNQFGEEGCDQIRDALQSDGHLDKLLTLE